MKKSTLIPGTQRFHSEVVFADDGEVFRGVLFNNVVIVGSLYTLDQCIWMNSHAVGGASFVDCKRYDDGYYEWPVKDWI